MIRLPRRSSSRLSRPGGGRGVVALQRVRADELGESVAVVRRARVRRDASRAAARGSRARRAARRPPSRRARRRSRSRRGRRACASTGSSSCGIGRACGDCSAHLARPAGHACSRAVAAVGVPGDEPGAPRAASIRDHHVADVHAQRPGGVVGAHRVGERARARARSCVRGSLTAGSVAAASVSPAPRDEAQRVRAPRASSETSVTGVAPCRISRFVPAATRVTRIEPGTASTSRPGVERVVRGRERAAGQAGLDDEDGARQARR